MLLRLPLQVPGEGSTDLLLRHHEICFCPSLKMPMSSSLCDEHASSLCGLPLQHDGWQGHS
jgi:hypothetical protein